VTAELATPTSTITFERPALYGKQRAFVDDPARYTVCEASTKSGKTVGCMVWLLGQACDHGGPGRHFWWVAPTYQQAAIAYFRMARWLATAAGMPAGVAVATDSRQCIKLANGSWVWFKGADNEDSLYGEDVWAAVVDEASRCTEKAWIALRSTLTATQAPVKIIGNVQGAANWFYAMARQAEKGAPGMSYHHLTAYDAVEGGVLQSQEVEDARRMLPDWAFQELYLARPSTATRCVFRPDALEWQQSMILPPILTLDYEIRQHRGEGRLGQYAVLHPAGDGPIKVWLLPTDQPSCLPFGMTRVERTFGIGADVSEGVGASDSAAVVFATDTMEQAAEFASNRISPSDFGRVLAALGEYYCDALVCPVRRMHGVTVLRAMIDDGGYTRVWRETTAAGMAQAPRGGPETYGWPKGESSNPALFGRYADLVAHRGLTLRSADTINQHRQYVYDEAGRITLQELLDLPAHVRERHGDRVIACALARLACQDSPMFSKVVKFQPKTLGEAVYGPGGYKAPSVEAKKW
jgi:hypothetical protein